MCPLGASKAITATARELARLVYRMLKHGAEYVTKGQAEYETKMRGQAEGSLKRKAAGRGFELVPKVVRS